MKKTSILILILVLGISSIVAAQPRRFMLTEEQRVGMEEVWELKAELRAELEEKMLELDIFPSEDLPGRIQQGRGRFQNKHFCNQGPEQMGKRARVRAHRRSLDPMFE